MSETGNHFEAELRAVGYLFETKTLMVSLTVEMAEKMKTDGWNVDFKEEIGHFVRISLTERES